MQIKKKALGIATFLIIIFSVILTPFVDAATPVLSVSATGTSDNVQVIVNGDANSSVILYYTKSGSGPQLVSLGTTSSSGYFSQTISTSSYGISPNSTIYVLVNSQQSLNNTWPNVSSSSLSLNQTTLGQSTATLASGQSVSITISGGTGTYIILNNSNPSMVQASISGSTVTLNAVGSNGSSSITVCSSNQSSCGVVNVNVGATALPAISFSQSSPTISTGQSSVVTISGGSGTYYISSNSNTSVVQATLSSSSLTLNGLASGNSSMVICSSAGTCGSIYVTVNYGSTGGTLSLSQNNSTISIGQNLSIIVSGGVSPYSLTSNSGTVFTSTLSGNIISLYGVGSGSSYVNICSAEAACIPLNVTVIGSGSISSLSLSQNNVSLNKGNTTTVILSGAGGYYFSGNTNQNISTATINGSSITISAINTGSNTISVCQSGGQCSSINVSVLASTVTTPTSSTPPSTFLIMSKKVGMTSVGKSSSTTISGGTSSLYNVSYNSSPSTIQTSMSGNTLTFSGLKTGTAVVVVCDPSSNCGVIFVIVGNNPVASSTTGTGTSISSLPKISQTLMYGDEGYDVIILQKKLMAGGFFDGPANGSYGGLTVEAVKKYQTSKGIKPIGNVGPQTLESLNS